MKVRRIVGAVAATTLATGALLLFAGSSGATPTPATPITFDATGLASTSCPVNLPLNNKIALPPGTPIQFNPGLVHGVLAIIGGSETLSVTPLNDAGQAIAPATTRALPWTAPVSYAAGTYKLTWVAKTLLGVITTTGTGILQVADGASGCQLAVSVPGVVVNPSQLPVVGGVVGSIIPPVSIPGVQLPLSALPLPGLPGTTPTPGPPPPGTTPGGQPGVNYHPTGPTVADLTVPHGYGGGSGAAGNYVAPGLSNSLVAPGTNFVTGGGKATTPASGAAGPVVPTPHTVDVASRSALDALPTLTVVLAVIALSGATAFYARTFLLHKPHTAKVG
jgi:hypothetical protein